MSTNSQIVEHDPVTGGQHGDTVCVSMPVRKTGTWDHQLYRLENRLNGQWPAKSENWFLCVEGRFPILVTQLKEWGAEFRVISP